MNNLVISWIRTNVPYAVSAIVAWLLTLGVEMSPESQAGLIAFLTWAIGSAYYLVVRKLERVNPKFGFLLGVASQPKYKK